MSVYDTAVDILKSGGIIAYPTEGVYGLGCDPFQERAVRRLLALKQRPMNLGLILIVENWSAVEFLVDAVPAAVIQRIHATEEPMTWVLPANVTVPVWVRGEHPTIAVRITQHPVARSLCRTLGGPLVSTSANTHGVSPARTADDVRLAFGEAVIDYIVEGAVGGLSGPTPIQNAITGSVLR